MKKKKLQRELELTRERLNDATQKNVYLNSEVARLKHTVWEVESKGVFMVNDVPCINVDLDGNYYGDYMRLSNLPEPDSPEYESLRHALATKIGEAILESGFAQTIAKDKGDSPFDEATFAMKLYIIPWEKLAVAKHKALHPITIIGEDVDEWKTGGESRGEED